jgi:bifunctional DNA-binding transcriptional regulator/antitoxin component of YhaV-PrlF toxin-antitoxin module
MNITMEITQTDASGKLCIPDKIFKIMGIKPGMKFQIQTKGNLIILKKIENPDTEFDEEDIQDLMKLSEESLKEFLLNEPDLYTEEDLRVKY